MRDTIKIQEFAVHESTAAEKRHIAKRYREILLERGCHEEVAMMDRMSGRNRRKDKK